MSEKLNKVKIDIIMGNYLLSRKYDLRRVDCEHPLWQNISKKIKLHMNDENPVDTFLDYAGVVFDDDSYNFHIFPANKKEYDQLEKEFVGIKTKIIEKMRSNFQIGKVKSGGGAFRLFKNIEKIMKGEPKISNKNIYQYIEVKKDGIFYSINFMRYTCNSEAVVGCTMREIQFQKSCGCINKANGFNICYTANDKNNTYRSIKYTTVKKKKEIKCENVCYNPPVKWPNMQPFDINATTYKFEEDLIKKIIDWFIYFIEKEGKKEDMTLDKYKKWKMQQVKNSF